MSDLTEDELDLLRQAFDWARTGEVARMTELLAIGVPPNLTNARGDTLLILAAYHCQEDMVRLLLEHRADAERYNDNGQTALAAAVFRQVPGIVGLLLDAGADPDAGPKPARQVAEFFGLSEMAALFRRPPPTTESSD